MNHHIIQVVPAFDGGGNKLSKVATAVARQNLPVLGHSLQAGRSATILVEEFDDRLLGPIRLAKTRVVGVRADHLTMDVDPKLSSGHVIPPGLKHWTDRVIPDKRVLRTTPVRPVSIRRLDQLFQDA